MPGYAYEMPGSLKILRDKTFKSGDIADDAVSTRSASPYISSGEMVLALMVTTPKMRRPVKVIMCMIGRLVRDVP